MPEVSLKLEFEQKCLRFPIIFVLHDPITKLLILCPVGNKMTKRQVDEKGDEIDPLTSVIGEHGKFQTMNYLLLGGLFCHFSKFRFQFVLCE